jgi:hypothetical protein
VEKFALKQPIFLVRHCSFFIRILIYLTVSQPSPVDPLYSQKVGLLKMLTVVH